MSSPVVLLLAEQLGNVTARDQQPTLLDRVFPLFVILLIFALALLACDSIARSIGGLVGVFLMSFADDGVDKLVGVNKGFSTAGQRFR